jgi:hypothetical protein
VLENPRARGELPDHNQAATEIRELGIAGEAAVTTRRTTGPRLGETMH